MELFLSEEFKKEVKNLTPVIAELKGYIDADEELLVFSEYVRSNFSHNREIEPKRIKYLYADAPKKDGGRFVLTNLFMRSDMEKMVNDEYDYILTVFYHVWKDLTPEQKVVALDKALCGIDMGDMEKAKLSKKAPDSKEYTANLNCFGPESVMKLSELIDLRCQTILEERKENEKQAKGKKKGKFTVEDLN
jgi:hypothetical protein